MTHLNKFKDLLTWFPKYMDLDETLGQVQGPRVDFTLSLIMKCSISPLPYLFPIVHLSSLPRVLSELLSGEQRRKEERGEPAGGTALFPPFPSLLAPAPWLVQLCPLLPAQLVVQIRPCSTATAVSGRDGDGVPFL